MRIYKTIFGKLSAAKQISGTIQAVPKLEASLTIPKIEELKTYSYDGVDSVTGPGYSRVDHTVTVKASGLYTISFGAWRSTSSGTSGTALYINGVIHGKPNTAFSGNGQYNHYENVELKAGDVITIRARARNTSSHTYVTNLIVKQTAKGKE